MTNRGRGIEKRLMLENADLLDRVNRLTTERDELVVALAKTKRAIEALRSLAEQCDTST